jgi:hypothetical protein
VPRVLLLSGMLLGLLWLATTWGSQPAPADAALDSPWRRTVQGWESIDRWTMPARSAVPPIHPLTLAAGQGLAAALVLVGSRRWGSRPAGK